MDARAPTGISFTGRVIICEPFSSVPDRGGSAVVMSASSEQDPRPAAPAKAGGPGGRSSALLGLAVAGLVLVAVTDLLGLVAGLRVRGAIDGEGGDPTAVWRDLEDAASFYDSVARYQVITYLLCAIVFVTWFFHLRRVTGLMAPDGFQNGPGMAIGAWLIPVANLWLPYRVAADMWRAAAPPAPEADPYRERLWPVNVWWVLFVLGILGDRVAAAEYDSAGTLADIRSAVTQSLVSDALGLLAAVAAVHFAVRLTGMQRRKAAEGPYPASPFTGASR
jgi:hypothetical protein